MAIWKDVTELVFSTDEYAESSIFSLMEAAMAVEVGNAASDPWTKTEQLEVTLSPSTDYISHLLSLVFAWVDGAFFHQTLWQCEAAHEIAKMSPRSDRDIFVLSIFGGLVPAIRRFVRAESDEFFPQICGPSIAEWEARWELHLGCNEADNASDSVFKVATFFICSWIACMTVEGVFDNVERMNRKWQILRPILGTSGTALGFSAEKSRPYWPSGPPRVLPVLENPVPRIENLIAAWRSCWLRVGGAVSPIVNSPVVCDTTTLIDFLSESSRDNGRDVLVRACAEQLLIRRGCCGYMKMIRVEKTKSEFVREAALVLDQTTKTLLNSPVRFYRNLKRLLPHWAAILSEALKEDASFDFQSCTVWAADSVCQLVLKWYAVGFELGLISNAKDACVCYWVMECITTTRLHVLKGAMESKNVSPGNFNEVLQTVARDKMLYGGMVRLLVGLVTRTGGSMRSDKNSLQDLFRVRTEALQAVKALFGFSFEQFRNMVSISRSEAEKVVQVAVEVLKKIPTDDKGLKKCLIANQLAAVKVVEKIKIRNHYHSVIVDIQ